MKPIFQPSGRFAVGPNGEPEITLEGRYDDEDHKILAVYGAMLVGEKCRPNEKINLVSSKTEIFLTPFTITNSAFNIS